VMLRKTMFEGLRLCLFLFLFFLFPFQFGTILFQIPTDIESEFHILFP
jgi:hypothetical protein